MKVRGEVAQAVKRAATRFEGAEPGVACAGTSLESTTWNSGGKAFVFAAVKDGTVTVRVRLVASAAEAKKLSKASPDRISIGSGNWAKLCWPETEKAPLKLLARWMPESHGAVIGASPKA